MSDFAGFYKMIWRTFLTLLISVVFQIPVDSSAVDFNPQSDIPPPLLGPYIIDPGTLMELDNNNIDCNLAGPLNFQCLVFRDGRSSMKKADFALNPFMLRVFEVVRETARSDLKSLSQHEEYGGEHISNLDTGFLEYPGARIELVGVVNRMDRQFNRDKVDGRDERLECGEISAIYRFAYEGRLPASKTGSRGFRSRLPVTMNVVFPARPWSNVISCKEIARRWLDYAQERQRGGSPSSLVHQARLIVSALQPSDIDRIELNMQGSRVGAGRDDTDFGTLGTYVIRVFRWFPGPDAGRWKPSYLTNQIDRARLLGKAGDENTCEDQRGVKLTRQALVEYILSQNAIGDVDNGLMNIPKRFLACRAISISPGGASRSGNQPFWNSKSPAEQIITDAEIETALLKYKKTYSLSYVGNALEFRTRLNEASCSGCHQTRSIAGFHFPGSDRPGTSPVNAVFLPGSAHFFGDQLRRIDILKQVAAGKTSKFSELAMSYAARPLNKFVSLKPTGEYNIQLIGGWGATCLVNGDIPIGVRKWGCAEPLICRSVFQSSNQLGIGICTNSPAAMQIGDAMQTGLVMSKRFGVDQYTRSPKVQPAKNGLPRDTTISTKDILPIAPTGNSYVASHQEFYRGRGGLERLDKRESLEEHARRVRDQETGGFPAGALRLAECVGLPSEATCGLLAASGFNDCLDEVGDGERTPEDCFGIYTNYSGVRGCNAANPCRDDYICLNSMGYNRDNARIRFNAGLARRNAARLSANETEKNRKRLTIDFFGEKMPDAMWLGRNNGAGDDRGLCIPPYFVFQFKADGHRVPKEFVAVP